MLLYLLLWYMSEYAWMCLFEQDSEYASGPKYSEILNMAKFSIWQGSQYASVTQRSKYYKNMPWQGSEYILGSKYEYSRALNMQELHSF